MFTNLAIIFPIREKVDSFRHCLTIIPGRARDYGLGYTNGSRQLGVEPGREKVDTCRNHAPFMQSLVPLTQKRDEVINDFILQPITGSQLSKRSQPDDLLGNLFLNKLGNYIIIFPSRSLVAAQ